MVKRKASQVSADQAAETSNEDAEDQAMEVKPIGEVIKKTGRGRSERKFYEAFELDGARYNLEDSVLVTPEEKSQKPYVAIIKEIKESKDGSIAVTGQWFYRPEEAERKGGGSWVADDTRELFYSFHRDEVPAESVMHKCVVHFIPSNKKSPPRTKHPGFIVRKVYDTVEKKLWNLTDKDYEDAKQKEIDLLVQKTEQALGSLQDIDGEEAPADPEPEKAEKSEKVEKPLRKTLRKKNVPHPPALSIVREAIALDEEAPATGKTDGPAETPVTAKAETPGSARFEVGTPASDGDINAILRQSGAYTGTKARDRWIEKLVQSLKSFFEPKGETENGSEAAKSSTDKQFTAEETVAAVCALEKAAFDAIGDIHKYNLKMRSLDYNLRIGHVLARRLLAKELEPLTIVNMSPTELKDGMTAAEKSAQEPEQPQTVQMADVRCTLCGEPQVGVKDIINAPHGDRYQLECLKCGNNWYSARDSISSLTIETVNPSPTVGTAPWATSKFEEVQKRKESEKENENENKESKEKESKTSEDDKQGGEKLATEESQKVEQGGTMETEQKPSSDETSKQQQAGEVENIPTEISETEKSVPAEAQNDRPAIQAAGET